MTDTVSESGLSVAVATHDDAPVVGRLLQLYLYDMADFTGETLNPETGQFDYAYFDEYWADPHRTPYLLRIGEQPVGFCLTNRWTLFYEPPESARSIAEFFVLKQYRRSGVGRTAALSILESNPGDWEIRALASNGAAVVFWGNVAATLRSRGHHSELLHSSDDRYAGFVWKLRVRSGAGLQTPVPATGHQNVRSARGLDG